MCGWVDAGQVTAQKFAKSKVAVRRLSALATNMSHTGLHPSSVLPNPQQLRSPLQCPKISTVPPRQIKSHSNKQRHSSGNPLLGSASVGPRLSWNECAAKAQPKEARYDERRWNIRRAADFEHSDTANEDTVDANPRPCSTPKRCAPRNRKWPTSPLSLRYPSCDYR
jgi:hypothetical protein